MAPLTRKTQPTTIVTSELVIDGTTIASNPRKMRAAPSTTKIIQESCIGSARICGHHEDTPISACLLKLATARQSNHDAKFKL
jgi:hypothetical protein